MVVMNELDAPQIASSLMMTFKMLGRFFSSLQPRLSLKMTSTPFSLQTTVKVSSFLSARSLQSFDFLGRASEKERDLELTDLPFLSFLPSLPSFQAQRRRRHPHSRTRSLRDVRRADCSVRHLGFGGESSSAKKVESTRLISPFPLPPFLRPGRYPTHRHRNL